MLDLFCAIEDLVNFTLCSNFTCAYEEKLANENSRGYWTRNSFMKDALEEGLYAQIRP